MTTIREKGHRFCQVSRAGVINFRRELHGAELFLFRYEGKVDRARYEQAIERHAFNDQGELRVPNLHPDTKDSIVVATVLKFREHVLRQMEIAST